MKKFMELMRRPITIGDCVVFVLGVLGQILVALGVLGDLLLLVLIAGIIVFIICGIKSIKDS